MGWMSGSDSDSCFQKGMKLVNKKRYEEAVQQFHRGIECDKGHSNCWYGLGEALSGVKKYTQAEECYTRAFEINPDNDDYLIGKALNLRNLALMEKEPLKCFEAIECCNKVLTRNHDYVPALHAKGLTLWTLNKRDDAIEYFDKALKLDKNYDYPYELKGKYFFDQRKYHDAIDAYEIALKKSPRDPDILLSEGRCLMKIGAYHLAIKCFQLVIKQRGDDPHAYVLLGNSYKVLKQFDDAIEAYEQALEINPDNKTYKMQIAEAYLLQGNICLHKDKDPQTAIEYFNKTLEIAPRYSAAWFSKSIAYRKMGGYRNSLNAMLKTIEIDPNNAHAYFEMGKTLKSMGNETEAIDCFLQAIRIDPSYTEAMYILGNILVDAGRPSTAITYFDQIIDKDPGSSIAWYAKGKALKLMNETREANICFERAGKIAVSK
ncbi:tetratricopeptide repeat protein [Methanospirillum sp. J.3.6.1-F.2.7.3]|jgi:superkiller protein 3|uniref:Tetratricopeptide repeat protein n=1 Tax=Methanospirillum purgamenti TaxID=2834276 RepID=A0A8E7AWX7_9EURY|nr:MULTISPECIES: tetratricopeptide repeat protein [Methanospirillum]MDX8549211.1 tetratricopeptide repeat protein [Methanospirillum hungatei]QVV88880.1 tetratricopeptide repeat protein [Methanospirillum sp. J.3.6.1-F.2.7.3]